MIRDTRIVLNSGERKMTGKERPWDFVILVITY